MSDEAYNNQIPQIRRANSHKVVIPLPFRSEQLFLPSIITIVIFIIGVVLFYINRVNAYWKFEAITGLASAGTGGILGLLAQMLYSEYAGELPLFGNGCENPEWLGGLLGCVIGFLVGVLYAQNLRGLYEIDKSFKYKTFISALTGIAFGLICSGLVHILLMLSYSNWRLEPITIGLIFGIAAGAILGICIYEIYAGTHKAVTKEQVQA